MTLEDVEKIPKEFLRASDIAPYLKSGIETIIYCARHEPELLGFPVIVLGRTVRIPKYAFIYFCRYGRPIIDYNLLAAAVTEIEQQKRNKED